MAEGRRGACIATAQRSGIEPGAGVCILRNASTGSISEPLPSSSVLTTS